MVCEHPQYGMCAPTVWYMSTHSVVCEHPQYDMPAPTVRMLALASVALQLSENRDFHLSPALVPVAVVTACYSEA